MVLPRSESADSTMPSSVPFERPRLSCYHALFPQTGQGALAVAPRPRSFMHRRRMLAGATVATAVVLGLLSLSSTTSPRVSTGAGLSAIDSGTFWAMVSAYSESGGYFRSDNFVSNETTFQKVIPALNGHVSPGGAYLGVGPDQNFTYIVALRPDIAFIVDIRRQNMLLHLLYKALVELSADRAEFVSRLFSRPRPEGLCAVSTVEALFDA